MITYSQFKPSQFDCHIELENLEDWFVVCSQNRDSETLTVSNFYSILENLGGESETVEVHRFGHWASGWFELILLHPSRQEEGEEIESALSDYSVFNDSDLSERELEAENESWENYGRSDFAKALKEEFTLSASTISWFEKDSNLFTFHNDYTSGPEHTSEGVRFNFNFLRPMSRDKLAEIIKGYRRRK